MNTGEGKTYTKIFGVHEHQGRAEQILGRPLREARQFTTVMATNETTPENLIIFRSQSEHAKHHAEMKWFLRELAMIEEVMPMKFIPHDYQTFVIRYIEEHPIAAVLLDMGLS